MCKPGYWRSCSAWPPRLPSSTCCDADCLSAASSPTQLRRPPCSACSARPRRRLCGHFLECGAVQCAAGGCGASGRATALRLRCLPRAVAPAGGAAGSGWGVSEGRAESGDCRLGDASRHAVSGFERPAHTALLDLADRADVRRPRRRLCPRWVLLRSGSERVHGHQRQTAGSSRGSKPSCAAAGAWAPTGFLPPLPGTPVGTEYGGWLSAGQGCVDVSLAGRAADSGRVYEQFIVQPIPGLGFDVQPPDLGLVNLPKIFYTTEPTSGTTPLTSAGTPWC